jgi:two-component system, sporulation sensor kinase E
MDNGFLDRLIDRMEQVDPKSLQAAMMNLAQERGLMELIFQSIQEGIIVVDSAAKLTFANQAAEKLIGFSFKEAKGRPILKYLRDIDIDSILKHEPGDLTHKMVSQEIEILYPDPRYVSFYVVPLSETENNGGAVMILRDVTSERENEASVIESERLNAIKLLAAGVAHEIGNPLNALNIHLQLLEREIDDISNENQENLDSENPNSELKDLVHVARNEVSRLDLIITQFLRAIRPTQPDFQQIAIDAILKDSLTLLGREISNREIVVNIDCPKDLPVIKADPGQIKQAFFNIIKNSFQAMPDGGALTVKCSCSSEYLSISFQDTGEGIKPEDYSRIFDAYHTTKKEGTGLGLMIVERIVQDHGGQIEVASIENKGSSFTIRLPLAERRIRLLNK